MTEHELMLTQLRHCRRTDLYIDPQPLTPVQDECLAAMRERRSQGEPLQYILGECDFYGMMFKVDPRVLIPRPETEILVNEVLNWAQAMDHRPLRILDVGTGSGVIAVTLAKNLPQAKIVAIDVSRDALVVAAANAARHQVAGQIEFVNADMRDFFTRQIEAGTQFDAIVSNPPYVAMDVVDYLSLEVQSEPRVALDGGDNGMKFYEPIIRAGCLLLRGNGRIFLEFGDGQDAALKRIFESYAEYADVRFVLDCSNVNRVAIATRAASVKDEQLLNKK